MSRKFNPFSKEYNLDTFGDFSTANVRGQYNLANIKKQIIKIKHMASGEEVRFQAFDLSLQDTYSINYNSTNVYGRMDPISTYTGTRRNGSLSFGIPANSLDEAQENLLRVQKLVQMQYPVYENLYPNGQISATTIKAPPLLRIKVMNLARDVSSIPDSKNSFFSPAGFERGDGKGYVVALSNLGVQNFTNEQEGFQDPRPGVIFSNYIKINMSFVVLHTHPLGYIEKCNAAGEEKIAFRQPNFPYGLDNNEAKGLKDCDVDTPSSDTPKKNPPNTPRKPKSNPTITSRSKDSSTQNFKFIRRGGGGSGTPPPPSIPVNNRSGSQG